MNTPKSLVCFALSLFLTACAANKVAVTDSIQQKSAQEASESKFTPEQAIDDAAKKLLEAKQNNLDFFSPLHLKQAEESIALAREYLTNPPEDMNNAPLMSAIAAQRYIDSAYSNKETVEVHLEKSLSNLEILKEIQAPVYISDDYKDILESLTDIIEEIEQGDIQKAKKSEVDLLDDMADAEIDTLKIIHLSEADDFIEKASDIDADKFAVVTFEKAEAKLDSANKIIEKYYRDRAKVKKVSDEAIIAAQKTYYVALESIDLVRMDPETAEQHTLTTMGLLNTIYIAAKSVEIPPERLRNQSNLIVTAVEDLKKQTTQTEIIETIEAQSEIPTNAMDLQSEDAELEIEQLSPATQPDNYQSLEGLEDPITEDDTQNLNADEQGFDSIENKDDQ